MHPDFITVKSVNAANCNICELFKKDNILFENLISNISDSANYMGSKASGLEIHLQDSAPHSEKLDDDLRLDFKYSPDLPKVL